MRSGRPACSALWLQVGTPRREGGLVRVGGGGQVGVGGGTQAVGGGGGQLAEVG